MKADFFKADASLKDQYGIEDVLKIMSFLRSEDGCPWDQVQTHESLLPNLLEESYELVDAILLKDASAMKEELGDLLLQAIFHAEISTHFDFQDICDALARKLITRHSHLFGDDVALDPDTVLETWEKNKNKEKKLATLEAKLKAIPKSFPALMRSNKVIKKTNKHGFAFQREEDILAKLDEELREVKEAKTKFDLEEELGDLLFVTTIYAEKKGINPELALQKTVDKFVKRTVLFEDYLERENLEMAELSDAKWEEVWDQVKKEEKNCE